MSSPSTETIKAVKHLALVIKSLYLVGAVVLGAVVWVVTLAADVEANAEKLAEAATQQQVASVANTLERIERSLEKSDDRQRQMKSQLDKVEADVKTLKQAAE